MAVSFTGGERSFPDRFSKKVFGSGCIWSWPDGVRSLRGPRAAIVEGDFLGTPCRALVETVWVVGLFPSEESLLRLVTGVLIEISETWETGKAYLKLS